MNAINKELIRCWFDGSDQDEKICIQKRRSAKILAHKQRPLPFPQCLKCKTGMGKEYQEVFEHAEAEELRDVRHRQKRLDDYCLNCGGLMPEDAPRNRLYCSQKCRKEQKKIKNREWAKRFKDKQTARAIKPKDVTSYRYSLATKELLERENNDLIGFAFAGWLDEIYDKCYTGKKTNRHPLAKHKRVLDALERESLSGCNLFEKTYVKLPSGQTGRAFILRK